MLKLNALLAREGLSKRLPKIRPHTAHYSQ